LKAIAGGKGAEPHIEEIPKAHRGSPTLSRETGKPPSPVKSNLQKPLTLAALLSYIDVGSFEGQHWLEALLQAGLRVRGAEISWDF
jgi:hypothetical protein